MWMMPLHLHINQKSDYDMMINMKNNFCYALLSQGLEYGIDMGESFQDYS